MKTVYFRVDGNDLIASGHVMRCLAIAKQIRNLEAQVQFIVADDKSVTLIEQMGFSYDILDSFWNNLDQETEKMIAYIKRNSVKVLFIDSYYVSNGYLEKLSQYTKVIYLDDLNRFVYPVHTIINYGMWFKSDYCVQAYRKKGLNTEFMLGAKYVPLREEFETGHVSINKNVNRVLITTGGTDQLHVARKLLEVVMDNRSLCDLEYHVISGCFNKDKKVLYKMSCDNSQIHIHESVRNMAWWMQQSDVAVSASGTTLYEFAACGTPTVCLEVAENQQGADKWEKNKYMYYAGNAATDIDTCIDKCVDCLIKYKNSYELRYEYSERMKQLVDGKGAGRIAQYLLGLV